MAKDTKGKGGAPGVDGEKNSPTDLQEIQMQMNAVTDEVNILYTVLTRFSCSLDAVDEMS